MFRNLSVAFLLLVIGFAAGFITSGFRLTNLQEKAAAEAALYESKKQATTEQRESLEKTTELIEQSHAGIQLRVADYELLKRAFEKGAIDLNVAPELTEVLNRQPPKELTFEDRSAGRKE